MRKLNLLNGFFLLLISITLFSCQGKDGAPGPVGNDGTPGPAGPAGPPGPEGPNAIAIKKEGFIRGTVTGNRMDGTAYSYAVDFQRVVENNTYMINTYKVISPSETFIKINKQFSGDGEPLSENSIIEITFSVPNLSSLTQITKQTFAIHFDKDLGNNELFEMDTYSGPGGQGTIVLSNLSYSAVTGIITGDFIVNIPASQAGYGSVNIENGSFSTKLMRSVSRIGDK